MLPVNELAAQNEIAADASWGKAFLAAGFVIAEIDEGTAWAKPISGTKWTVYISNPDGDSALPDLGFADESWMIWAQAADACGPVWIGNCPDQAIINANTLESNIRIEGQP